MKTITWGELKKAAVKSGVRDGTPLVLDTDDAMWNPVVTISHVRGVLYIKNHKGDVQVDRKLEQEIRDDRAKR